MAKHSHTTTNDDAKTDDSSALALAAAEQEAEWVAGMIRDDGLEDNDVCYATVRNMVDGRIAVWVVLDKVGLTLYQLIKNPDYTAIAYDEGGRITLARTFKMPDE